MDKLRAQQYMVAMARGGVVKWLPQIFVNEERYEGKVYSKGRPRFSANGHAFTPKNTREFEADVADWMNGLGVTRIHVPVKVDLVLFDPIPKSAKVADKFLMEKGLVTSTKGDIDNRAKGILDAMNELLLMDDKQVNELHVSRQYDYDEGFQLTVRRNGFSPAELDMLKAAYVKPT